MRGEEKRSELTEANIESGREDAPSGWQSIETAPKDGQSIIAFVPGFGMGAMVLFWMDGRWREPAQMLGLKSEPSHWMALPAAPDGGAGVPVHAPAETATGSDQNLILSLTKEVEALQQALRTVSYAVTGWPTAAIKSGDESLSVRDYIDRALSTSGRAS